MSDFRVQCDPCLALQPDCRCVLEKFWKMFSRKEQEPLHTEVVSPGVVALLLPLPADQRWNETVPSIPAPQSLHGRLC